MVGVRQIDRDIYDLLVNKHPNGLDRDSLRQLLGGIDDRSMRESLERVRLLAATNAHRTKGYRVVGYDPQVSRYVDAQTAEQAQRVMAYYHARIKSEVDGLNAMLNAFQHQHGELPPEVQEVQATLFDFDRVGRRVSQEASNVLV